jgi:hypothetical protein
MRLHFLYIILVVAAMFYITRISWLVLYSKMFVAFSSCQLKSNCSGNKRVRRTRRVIKNTRILHIATQQPLTRRSDDSRSISATCIANTERGARLCEPEHHLSEVRSRPAQSLSSGETSRCCRKNCCTSAG